MKTNYKKGGAMMWVVVLIVIVLIAGFFIMKNKTENGDYQPTNSPSTSVDTGAQSSTSLDDIDAETDSIGAELDSIDVENIDK